MDSTGPDDQVARLRRLQARHPKWQIISPRDIRSVLRGEVEWRALSPGGELIRARELRDLLNEIERDAGQCPPAPPDPPSGGDLKEAQ